VRGVERRVRVLEHGLHAAPELRAVRRDVPARAVQRDRPGVRPGEPEQQARRGRLARPGLADQPEGPADGQVQVDVVHREGAAPATPPELLAQPGRDEQRRGVRRGGWDQRRGVGAGDRRDQRPGVRPLRGGEHPRRRPVLDHAPLGHHHHPVRPVPGDAEVVRDEEQPGARPADQVLQVVEDPALHRDVQGGGRLVGDDQPRPGDDGHRDQHPLPLPAGQLVRQPVREALRVVQPREPEGVDGQVPRGRAPRQAVHPQHLGDLLHDRVQGVERRLRVLRHGGDPGAVDPGPPALRQADELPPVERDAAADLRAAAVQAEHRPRRRPGARRARRPPVRRAARGTARSGP
jgi:hypothetical protein